MAEKVPGGCCQEGQLRQSAERAVTSAVVTDNREDLGGFVRLSQYALSQHWADAR
jgi:hypothetical protein